MRTTRYFGEQVLRKRPYLKREWIEQTIAEPIAREVQDDGRIRLFTRVELEEPNNAYILRVVVLEDGETVHNAFFDRDYGKAER